MSPDFFKHQMTRLQTRFGNRSIDSEFVLLVWRECKDMSEQAFLRSIDLWIGSRAHNRPPLLAEFREARLFESKMKFQAEVQGAANTFNRKAPAEMRKHLQTVLSQAYGGVESASDALEIERHKRQLAKANNEGGT